MEEMYRGECVEETRKALMKMNRTDLVQRLSDKQFPPLSQRVSNVTSVDFNPFNFDQSFLGSNVPTAPYFHLLPHADLLDPGDVRADKQFPPLSQRVEMMELFIELLLETLADLRGSELKDFIKILKKKYFLLIPLSLFEMSDLQHTVLLMVQTYGRQSVEKIVEVLKEMKRTDLAQRLTDSSSEDQNKHLDEHLFALIHKVATMAAVKDLLVETLEDLSDQDLMKFKTFLQFTRFQKSLPQIELTDDRREIVNDMIDKLGQQSVEVIREVLTDMQRTDLVQRLSESSSGLKAAGSSAEGFDVEETEKEKHSEDERWPALIHKVETMESVIELLLETLDGLNEQELSKFNKTLRQIHFHKYYSDFSWMPYRGTDLQDTVFLMVQTYGQQSVEKTMEVLKEMKRTDLAQRLSDCSSLPRKKHSVDERRSALIHKVATMAAVKHLHLEYLNILNNDELQDFQRFLRSIFHLRNLLYSSTWLNKLLTRADIVNLMVDELGLQSVEVTRDFFMYMNRTDLVQKLSDSSSASREKHSADEHGAALLKRILFQEEALTAVRNILVEILRHLNQKDLEEFNLLLQFTCFKMGLPQIQIYTKMTDELMNQMVDECGHQSVEVIREVLTDMQRTDLVQRLSESSSGLKAAGSSAEGFDVEETEKGRKTERSSELEGCQSMTQDSSDWTKLEPEVNSTDADEAPTYSLQSAAGHFECRVSGLRWVCKGKTSFQYQFRSWEGHMERMESRQYMPAGPLMDVTVTAGKLNEVHLPHWICIDDVPDILDMFAVVHIDDCGDVVEKVSEVTPTHVKLTEPNFSIIAALIRFIFPPKISCYMLMYYQLNTSFLKLHVYLIRQDPALEQEIAEKYREKKDETKSDLKFKKIIKHPPDQYLQTERLFSLKADDTSAKIQPEELTLRYNRQNFYEVYFKNPGSELILTLVHTHPADGEPADEPLWKCEIRADDHPESGQAEAAGYSVGAAAVSSLSAEENTVDNLSAQMQKVLTVQSDRERLLEMLEHLEKEELEKFKWLLVELKPIPKSKLEEANICNLVDLMFGAYTQHTVEVTKKVFRKMNRNDLLQKLSDTSSRSKD
ncbi:uncharacterized protein LOC102080324 [Oreochromis niloticus]|uniref:uncharacterized protein LOC102080324 n=1 Tax=Oreochromis niloticus TaxID=8128 RepID=UPI0009053BAE|nr:uncharacterized protein LOC102080324 [Oreochromis niloticus]